MEEPSYRSFPGSFCGDNKQIPPHPAFVKKGLLFGLRVSHGSWKKCKEPGAGKWPGTEEAAGRHPRNQGELMGGLEYSAGQLRRQAAPG